MSNYLASDLPILHFQEMFFPSPSSTTNRSIVSQQQQGTLVKVILPLWTGGFSRTICRICFHMWKKANLEKYARTLLIHPYSSHKIIFVLLLKLVWNGKKLIHFFISVDDEIWATSVIKPETIENWHIIYSRWQQNVSH